jgi:hypothetical protein
MNLKGSFSESDKTKTYVLPPRSGFHVFMEEWHENNPTFRYLARGPTATFMVDYLPIIDALWNNLTTEQAEKYERKAISDRERCRLESEVVFPFGRQEEGELEDGGGEGVEGGPEDGEGSETGDMAEEDMDEEDRLSRQLERGSEHGRSGVEDGASGETEGINYH